MLVIVFTVAAAGRRSPTAFNFANLINQGAAIMVIAMGLVFVLLLGEIDLSAGFTAGTAAAVLGRRDDQPRLAVARCRSLAVPR